MSDKVCPVKVTEDGRKIIGDGAQLDYLLPKQTFHSTWDSPEAYSRYIESLDPKNSWNGSDSWNSSSSFYGSKNMDEAVSLCRYGWKEGADKIEKLRSAIQAANPKSPKMIKYGLAGTTPNVPRAVAGNLFNMRLPEGARSAKKPVITLVANMSASCMIDAQMICNRAAAIAAIIDEIEGAGYACEVIATAMTRGHRDGFKAATSIIVKPSHQPVDTMKLAFSLGHSSFFRRMMFADWEVEPMCQSGLGYGLGHVGGGYKEETKELLEKGIYMLPSNQERSKYFTDDKTAMTMGLPFLLQHLKELGCPPFKDIPSWKDPDHKDLPGFPVPDYDEDDDF